MKNWKLQTEATLGLIISLYHILIETSAFLPFINVFVQKIEVCKKCREFDETQMSQILRQTAKYH